MVWVTGRDDVFKFVAGVDKGGRPYVSRKNKAIVLASGVRRNTIAHEIGHVLGFKDKYYDVWHPESCQWFEQTLDQDLMSNSDIGDVTPAEWHELDRRYPVKVAR